MKDLRIYYYRGTPDCPIAIYHNQVWPSTHTFTHWHTDAELLMVQKGSLTAFADEQQYALSPGDIILWEPATIHGIHEYSPDAQWIQVIFSQEAIMLPPSHFFQQSFVTPLFEGRLRFPRLVLHGHPLYADLFQVLSQVQDCTMGKPNFKALRFSLAIRICSLLIPWCISPKDNDKLELPENNAVKKAAIYIHNRLTQKLQLSRIAKHVHLHPNYLCALFKKHMGQTIFQHIAQARVEYAASLLRQEELSVAQVAEESGFASSSQFFKKFKEFMGISPLAYAKQQKNIALAESTDPGTGNYK